MDAKITAMLIMTRERRAALLDVLEVCGISVVAACDWTEASQILETRTRVDVVLTDEALADGTWRSVLAGVQESRANVEVIVCSRLVDRHLWIDALESGAYDLLVEPYEPEEARRVLGAAAARSRLVS